MFASKPLNVTPLEFHVWVIVVGCEVVIVPAANVFWLVKELAAFSSAMFELSERSDEAGCAHAGLLLVPEFFRN